jgi:Ni,Fe-hydrogenase III large subunit
MLTEFLRDGRKTPHHRPYPRVILDPTLWNAAADHLAEGRFSLLGLWGEPGTVHMALHDPEDGSIGVVSLDCPGGRYPSIGRRHAPALRLERTLRDLFGLEPEGLPDRRPWLDHGRWGVRHPLGMRKATPPVAPPYEFLRAEGPGLHQIPVGPVHAGIIEPGHFRFSASGETVVRLEERLGYAHKGVEGLMAGADLERAAQLAGRLSGDSTVAYALAFSRAAEAALEVEIPPRAMWLRALMAELERLANHFGDIGAICNDASFALMHAHCGVLRERVLRATQVGFGHRLMRDCVLPGGVRYDLRHEGDAVIGKIVGELRHRFARLVGLYEETTSLQDRTVGTGVLTPALARQYAAGGYVGRASGRDFDARRTPGYPPYDALSFTVPVLAEGDVDARIRIRIREVEQSLALIEQILPEVPDGPLQAAVAGAGETREGLALVESFRGDVLVWLRMAGDGGVERCHLRDPSWFQWPLLEAVVEGNIVADFPLCNKSSNCSYSGHDL